MVPSSHDGGGDDGSRPAKRSRVLVACERCKRRRQKCDNAAGACSNCARSGASCTYPNYPASSYASQLEDKIAMLEARLRVVDPTPAGAHAGGEHRGQMATPSSIPPQRSPVATSSSGRLASGIGLLSSCAAAEPHYFGFSSGLTLAHFVEAGISADNGHSDISLPSLADRPFSKQVPTAQTLPAPTPAQHIGRQYIKAYLLNIHPLYPFIDEEEPWRLHGISSREEHLCSAADLARLHLIYAIGSRCLQLVRPRKVEKHLPEGHLVSAMQHIPEVLKSTSIHAVEIILLLALHSMRSPSGASVWHLCGFAMRLCLELGLHRPRPTQSSGERLEQQRHKLFWSVYIFERKSALVLGRPFAISDKDIEIPLPEPSGSGRIGLSLHRHYILLYQIHSKIRSTLHHSKSGASHEKIQQKVDTCMQRLEIWKDGMFEDTPSQDIRDHGSSRSSRVPEDSSDSGDDNTSSRPPVQDRIELLLEYFKARRSLLQPLLTEAGHFIPQLSDYAACADASGQICHYYRQLHRLSAMPFTLRDLHAVVIAGFTSVYCIMAHPSLYDARRANEIGACSTVLYVIAEQWKSAKRYRDAFEAVAERLVELLSTSQDEQQRVFSGNGVGKSSTQPFQDASNSARQRVFSSRARGVPSSTSATIPPEVQVDTSMDDTAAATDGLFSDFFEDSFDNFDMGYGDENLRDLLTSEGLDWFLNG